MRFWVPLLFLCLQAFAQNAEHQSGLIVMKDGRVIAMRGNYEVMGQEVHFTDGKGEMMSLPLSKVDLAATDRRNEKLRARGPRVPAEDDLVGQVEQYKQRKKASPDSGEPPPIVYQNTSPDSGAKPGPDPSPPASKPRDSSGANRALVNPPLTEGELTRLWQRRDEVANRIEPSTKVLFGILFLVFLLASLISFILQIYLVFTSFGKHFLWGLALVGAFLLPFLYWPLVGLLPTGRFEGLFGSLGLALNGLFSLLLFFYILRECVGSRLKLLFWWLAPSLVFLAMSAVTWFKILPVLREMALI